MGGSGVAGGDGMDAEGGGGVNGGGGGGGGSGGVGVGGGGVNGGGGGGGGVGSEGEGGFGSEGFGGSFMALEAADFDLVRHTRERQEAAIGHGSAICKPPLSGGDRLPGGS